MILYFALIIPQRVAYVKMAQQNAHQNAILPHPHILYHQQLNPYMVYITIFLGDILKDPMGG